MEAWVDERRKVRVDNKQFISLLKQRETEYLRVHAQGYDGVIDQGGGLYVTVNYGTGSHNYSKDTYGIEVEEKVYKDLRLFRHLISLLEQEERDRN